jgi:hypothetical protein
MRHRFIESISKINESRVELPNEEQMIDKPKRPDKLAL